MTSAAKDLIGIHLGDPLTGRELQVLHGISAGETNPQIGQRLYLSTQTIKTYGRRLYRKLGVTDRAAAVSEGYRRGLLHGAMLMDAEVLAEAAEEIAATRAAYVEVFVARNIQARPAGFDPGDVDGWRTQALAWWNGHHPALCGFEREHAAHRGAVG